MRRYHVDFDCDGGVCEGVENGMVFDHGTTYENLPLPKKAGYMFAGWWSTEDFAEGTSVSNGDVVKTSDLTLHAKWLRRRLWYNDSAFRIDEASTYDGCLLDSSERVCGSLQVKVGKPNKRTGVSKVKATVLALGKKKLNLSGSTYDGKVDIVAKDGRRLSLSLGRDGMTGSFDGMSVDGAKNVFASKAVDYKILAAQKLNKWQGAYIVVFDSASGYSGLSLEVGKKGGVKVVGTFADGANVSGKSQLLVGERECAIAVSWSKNASSVAFLVWLCEDGSVEISNIDGIFTAASVARQSDGAYLHVGARVHLDAQDVLSLVPGAVEALLPNGLEVRMDGAKFAVDKAGKVKLTKDKSRIDDSLLGTNPSGLKLSYKLKDSTFKGTFTIFTMQEGKLKKVKVNVSGVVMRSVGYGTATIKKLGSLQVTIE